MQVSQISREPNHQAIIEAIKEYLHEHRYTETLQSIEREHTVGKSMFFDSLNHALDNGEKESFFNIWNSNVSQELKSSTEGQVLEFYIRVFFAIYPCHDIKGRASIKDPNNKVFKQNMNDLKNFLESRGPALASLEEILPFYALPYMPNPIGHKGFKDLFTMKWLNELKLRVGNFIQEKDPQTVPTILDKMYMTYMENSRTQSRGREDSKRSQALEKEIQNLKHENEILVAQQSHLQPNNWEIQCREIYQTAKEFSKLLQLSLTGKAVNESLSRAAYEKLAKFDKIINKPSQELIENPSPQPSFFKSSEIRLIKGYSYLPPINYASIIRDISSLQDDLQICAILQALRWRLTRSQFSVRKEQLENYIRFNILCTIKPHDLLLDQLLTSTRRVKEFTVRFLNVISSESKGRSYLLQKDNLIALLVQILYSEKQDTILRQNALGVLQKLSLRKAAQSIMIELNMLDWLMKILKYDLDNIGDYTLEYAAALLMNLSLRKAGKNKLEEHASDVMTMLNKFLNHSNTQVKTYINGTLYSILTRQSMKEAAIKIGMEKRLRNLSINAEESIKRQISFILEQIKHEGESESSTEDEQEEVEDEEFEGDDLIAEEEDMDDIIVQQGVLTGEGLLREKYSQQGPHSSEPKKKRSSTEQPNAKQREVSDSSTKLEVLMRESPKRKDTRVVPAADLQPPKIEKAESEQIDYTKAFTSRSKIPRTPI
ncbi:ARMC9_2 [Blepharisma stoltei]|uniref:LisH domain-containing protein ARMC9 n=1 Tax=Blepharisma stoltei TaxID=1481888 RepID=A0AAU9IRR8_9CILI|nr:unnamed protein product [Blepharisma stoltei]